jgi:hypothetical protein
VFDAIEGSHPVIARQGDCQTCFMCEAYCPVDAMFVAPSIEPLEVGSSLLDVDHLVEVGFLGKYRRDLGWRPGDVPTAAKASNRPLAMQFRRMENLPPAKPAASTEPATSAA